jgi:hypothetical protein
MKLISKFLEVNRRIDLFKIVIAYLLITIAALTPVIIAFIGGQIESALKGYPVHEGNSGIIAIGWLSLLTFPVGLILYIICTVIYIKNVFSFIRSS